MLSKLSSRQVYAVGFLMSAFLVGCSITFQYGLELEPCPLCIIQRVLMVSLVVICGLGLVLNPKGILNKLVGLTGVAAASAGFGVAARHAWIQSLPADQVPSCGPGLSYMMDTFPLLQTLQMVLVGSGECAEVVWSLFGFGMPWWTALTFACFLIVALWQTFRRLPVAGYNGSGFAN
ncbi:disulfide bond formation protein B [Pelagibaculum spongiae]|uniref:Disulfide bond formation protein B n=1 Tax=Pelagibaculum spongiae TaxID=2080658 RepID=A0A2V1GZZ3_9GAMM|nr:disulfide bond formation protein B [Pelagibaculum spongiae]PVZ68333.1 disulfide bond formation protein B [Pelagibaculum spongiae]